MSCIPTHGHCRGGKESRAFHAWVNMRRRCCNPRAHNFANYGGRGIVVCAEWYDFASFLSDMGEPKAGQSLDRIDNNRGYEPGNCRWATVTDQNRNRRVTMTATAFGTTKPLTAWLEDERCAVRHLQVLWTRIRRLGWSDERAITTPGSLYRNRGRITITPATSATTENATP